MGPTLAQPVKLDPKDSSIRFKVRDEWGSGLTGRVSRRSKEKFLQTILL
jgi:hypothetical protein